MSELRTIGHDEARARLAAVKPVGRLFYETCTTRQAEAGHPKNPAFLLEAGELARLVAPFRVLRSREGEFDGRFIVSAVAGRPWQAGDRCLP